MNPSITHSVTVYVNTDAPEQTESNKKLALTSGEHTDLWYTVTKEC